MVLWEGKACRTDSTAADVALPVELEDDPLPISVAAVSVAGEWLAAGNPVQV